MATITDDGKLIIEMNLDKDFTLYLSEMQDKYGEEFTRLNCLSNDNLNHSSFINNFIDIDNLADVSIDANANKSGKDICALSSEMMKANEKLLAFNKIFYEFKKKYNLETAKAWLESEWNGANYLHDASTSTFKPYCFSYDLVKVVEEGLFFIDRFKSGPAQHLSTYNDHVLETISWLCNRSSGAVGLSTYLLYSWYFWNKDVKAGIFMKNPEWYRRQYFQKFIYDLNQPYLRESTQAAFTNISIMDRAYLVELFGGREFPDGSFAIDYIEEILEHQKVFMEVVSEIRDKLMMTFPVLTFSLLFQDGKFVDEETARWCSRHNMKWNDSNFYCGSDVTAMSNCCRLISKTDKLDAFINSIGGTALSIGSVKVNTVNLRRIALDSYRDKDKFFKILKERVDITIKCLDIIRSIIARNIEKGLLPNYSFGLIEMEKQYNTIGITAMYEVLSEFDMINEDLVGNKSYSDEGLAFAKQILDMINEQKESYGFDYSINVECIPAERANVVLSYKDRLLFPEEKEYQLYANQWIPLSEKCTIHEKIRLGAILDKECGGGQISHINLDGRLPDEELAWDLLNYIANKGVIYFAFNMVISTCVEKHSFHGNICPTCHKEATEKFTRIVGFYTPISGWSSERKSEFSNRTWYELAKLRGVKECE